MSTASLQERLAAAGMIVTLEKLASSGVLPLQDEIDVRLLTVRAAKAFAMDTIAERPTAEVLRFEEKAEVLRFEEKAEAVREVMAATPVHSR